MFAVRSTGDALLAYGAGAVSLAVVAWAGAYAGPGLWPAPLLMVVTAWTLGDVLLGNMTEGQRFIPLLGAVPFLALGIPLWSPTSRIVWPTTAFVALLVIASLVYFADAWTYGAEFQGIAYTIFAVGINGALAAACVWLCVRATRRPQDYARRYFAALLPCAWLAYCAFPWLGEVP